MGNVSRSRSLRTVINARWLLERDGRLIVTVPDTVEARTDELAGALATA